MRFTADSPVAFLARKTLDSTVCSCGTRVGGAPWCSLCPALGQAQARALPRSQARPSCRPIYPPCPPRSRSRSRSRYGTHAHHHFLSIGWSFYLLPQLALPEYKGTHKPLAGTTVVLGEGVIHILQCGRPLMGGGEPCRAPEIKLGKRSSEGMPATLEPRSTRVPATPFSPWHPNPCPPKSDTDLGVFHSVRLPGRCVAAGGGARIHHITVHQTTDSKPMSRRQSFLQCETIQKGR